MKYYRLGSLHTTKIYFSQLEAVSLRSRYQHCWVMAIFWAADFLLYTYIAEGVRNVSYKNIKTIHKGSTACPNHLSRTSPPNPITLSIRIPTCEEGKHKHSDHSNILANKIIIFLNVNLTILPELKIQLVTLNSMSALFLKSNPQVHPIINVFFYL